VASRRNSESFSCFWCDWWWLILLILALLLGGILGTRPFWEPLVFPTQIPISTPRLPSMPTQTLTPTVEYPHKIELNSGDPSGELCPGGIANLFWDVELSPAASAQYSDIVFAFDQTGSMMGVIHDVVLNSEELMNTIKDTFGEANFGVVGLADYPTATTPDDKPYQLLHPISANYASVRNSIGNIDMADGGDSPESYVRAMYESYSDSSIQWRENSRRFFVVFGDSSPHEVDAGRDGILGTIDDLFIENVLADMKKNNIILIFVAAPTLDETTSTYQDWNDWAESTGGMAVSLEDHDKIITVIDDAIVAASMKISTLEVTGPLSYIDWLSSNIYENLEIDDAGEEFTFSVEIEIPKRWPDSGDHEIKLQVIGDGALYAEMFVVITIPDDCPPN